MVLRQAQHTSLTTLFEVKIAEGWNKKDLPKGRSKSGGPGSNRQPLAWKAKALPLSYRREREQLYKNMAIFKGVVKKVVGKI